MERLRTLKTVVYAIAVILAVQLAFLMYVIKPKGMILLGFVVIILLCLYLVRVSLLVLGELIEANKKLNK